MAYLDPRTKLFLAIAFAVVLMFTSNVITLTVEFIAISLFAISLGRARAWLKMLSALVPMISFFVAVLFFSFDVPTAVSGALRLIALTTAFLIFFQTTLPEDLANALVQSGVPYAFAFILTASIQFVPVLSRKMQEVMDAQRARGIRLERDLASVRNYPALFTPMLIQAFILADQLAEAMEARGFGAPHRTFSREYRLRTQDWAAIAVGAISVGLAWMVR